MNILSVSNGDSCGCGYYLCDAINKYTCHKCVHIRDKDNSFTKFPKGYGRPSYTRLMELCNIADVIHVHDTYKFPRIPTKPVVVTYHGTTYRKSVGRFNKIDKKRRWVQTASTADLVLLGPKWMPDTRPSLEHYIDRTKHFSVCQSATNRRKKATQFVLEAMKGIPFDLIEKVDYKTAFARKGRAWVTIDQFRIGYGCSSIEAWMMGQPVIANAIDEHVIEFIEKQTGELPFVRCARRVDDIRCAVERLRDDSEHYKDMVRRGHEYVEKVHSQRAVAERAIRYYERAIRNRNRRSKRRTRR